MCEIRAGAGYLVSLGNQSEETQVFFCNCCCYYYCKCHYQLGHNELLLRHDTLQTFDQHDVKTKRQKNHKKRQIDKTQKGKVDKKTERQNYKKIS